MKSFSKSDFIVMALGNIIGSGIFLASSIVLTVAGVWTPLAYLLGGLIMMAEVSFIVEMTIANPVPGSFKVYAQEVFGNWWGFVVGWMFWVSGVLGMASEVTACAIFANIWFPQLPLWVLSLIFSLSITLINFNDVKGLSKIEFGLSVTKIIALILFLLLGISILVGLPIGPSEKPPVLQPIVTTPFAGLSGLLGSMLLIFFCYTGTGIIGIAAVETENPVKTVVPAAKLVTTVVVLLYTLATLFMVLLIPNNIVDPKLSPFIQLLTLYQIPYAVTIVNFILLTAALSALNSQVYSSSRMLFSLAKAKQAPKIVGYTNKKGVPATAVGASGIVLLLAVMLSYLLPEKIFVYAVSASGFLALINWMSVSATQFFYRRKLLRVSPEKLKYKAPGYPYLAWVCFATIFIAILSAPLYPDQLPGIYSGVIILLLISILYFLTKEN